MTSRHLLALAPASLRLALRRLLLDMAIRQSQRNSDVLNAQIAAYRDELNREQRRQVTLVNDRNKL